MWTRRCSWWPWSSKFGEVLGGSHYLGLVAIIGLALRYSWRPWSCELSDSCGGHNGLSLQSYLEAVIVWAQRCIWGQRSSEIGDEIAGCYCWCSQSGCGRLGGRHNGSWDIIYLLTAKCENVYSIVQQCLPRDDRWQIAHETSAKDISVRAEWLRHSGRAPSEPSETPRWRITPRPASIPRVALHISLRSQFRSFFSLCRSPISNKHSGVVGNCDHTSEWVHWVHICIGIAMQWVTLRKSLLAFHLH